MRWAILAGILLCPTSEALAQTKDLSALFPPLQNMFAPPVHVSRWISIQWAGDMNHPIIPVYYTLEKGRRPDGSSSRYVRLSRAEYKDLANFVRSYPCIQAGRDERSRSIGIEEFERGKNRDLCIFAQKPGCDFLFRLAALSGIDWSRKDTYPLYQLEAELGCKEPLTRSHDAEGRPN